MPKFETPLEGGSYIRGKDGKLEKVAGTEPAPPPGTQPEVADEQASTVVADPSAAEATAPITKGK